VISGHFNPRPPDDNVDSAGRRVPSTHLIVASRSPPSTRTVPYAGTHPISTSKHGVSQRNGLFAGVGGGYPNGFAHPRIRKFRSSLAPAYTSKTIAAVFHSEGGSTVTHTRFAANGGHAHPILVVILGGKH
jgi:hypothetical protein